MAKPISHLSTPKHQNLASSTSGDDDSDNDADARETLRLMPAEGESRGAQDIARNGGVEPARKPSRYPAWWPRRLRLSKSFWWLVFLFVACVLLLILLNVYFLVIRTPPTGQSPPWYPTPRGGTAKEWGESYKKAADMVRQMTIVEKVNVTTGIGWMMGMCVGNTGPVPRLGLPSLCFQDGPLGIRFADNITAFPAGITVGATWNRALMFERGQAHGLEAKLKGVNVLLGPAMGPIGRSPLGK